MRITRKEKKFITWLVIAWLLVVTEYSVYGFTPVVPQERLNEIVQIGSITPMQFEQLDEATVKIILERADVQSLLRNHFELLGLYGETRAGLILKTPEDWNRFAEPLALGGGTFGKVYDYWFREKIQNQSELLTGDEEMMEDFFEKHFSSTEENRLADGRLMGTNTDWGKFAYERGIPIVAGILLVMYQAWWKKKEEEPLEDWGGLEDIYAEKFETNNSNYGSFYGAIRGDNRIYSFPDWYPRIWEFWQKASAKLESENRFTNGVKELVTTVKNYISSRQAKQKIEFESSLQSVLAELSKEEIAELSRNVFTSEGLPEFLEKEVLEKIVADEIVRLKGQWSHFEHAFLTEKELTDFLKIELESIKDKLRNHPERLQEILAGVKTAWKKKFEEEKQEEIVQINAEAEAWYYDNIRYAVYNYQYQNVANRRGELITNGLANLEKTLAPQEAALDRVFDTFSSSAQEDKKALNQEIESIVYRQELVEEIDYVTPIAKLFPYQEPPVPPTQETIETTTQEIYETYKPVFEQEQEIEYLTIALAAAKALFDNTLGAQAKECKKLSDSLENKLVSAGYRLIELEKEIDPTANVILAHSEVYAEELSRIFDENLRLLDIEHQKMMTSIRESWTPYLNDPNYWTRTRAQQNMDGSIAYYQKKYGETRSQIKKYRAGSLFRKLFCAKIDKEKNRKNFNDKQKQNRINYAQKRKEDPAKKRVIQYLLALENAGPKSKFFEVQQSTILNTDTIQGEILLLQQQLAEPSPYDAEIQRLEEQIATPLAYSFEEYLQRTGIQNNSWVVQDDWVRAKRRIGRHGDYWGQKYAAYAQYIVRDFVPYDGRIVSTLRNAAMKAHQEKINSYNGWNKFYRQHPLVHEANRTVQNAKLGDLKREKEAYEKMFAEQIATLQKEVKNQTASLFTSAQWLNKTVEERQKDSFTEIILETEIKAALGENIAALDPTELIDHFSAVRESQLIVQNNNIASANRKSVNSLTFDESVMVAPIVARMRFAETPEGIAQKTRYFDAITKGVSDGSLSLKDPVIYERNDNGTYTAVYRDTGIVVGAEYAGIAQTSICTDSNGVAVTTQPATILDQVKVSLASQQIAEVSPFPEIVPVVVTVEEIAQTPEVVAEAEAIVEAKRLEVLNIGNEKELEAETRISLQKLLSIDSQLQFGLGVIDGVKSEIDGYLSLLNPLTWYEIAKVAMKFDQMKDQLLLSFLTDPVGMFEYLKETFPEAVLSAKITMDGAVEDIQANIANATDREKGAIVAMLVLSFIPIGKLGKASKLTTWVDDIAVALNKFIPQPKLAGVTVGGKTVIMDDVVRAGGKVIDYKKIDNVIAETLNLKSGQMHTSQHSLNADEILEATEKFLGKNYVKSGPHGYRSADGLRRFRMDPESLYGDSPHVHFELFDSPSVTSSSIINHVQFIQ